jgi:hypothetical protein
MAALYNPGEKRGTAVAKVFGSTARKAWSFLVAPEPTKRIMSFSPRKSYAAPRLTDYGDVAAVTATLGDPFTGDQSFDIDGSIIESGMNSINQCGTVNNEACVPETPGDGG